VLAVMPVGGSSAAESLRRLLLRWRAAAVGRLLEAPASAPEQAPCPPRPPLLLLLRLADL
jgi:hypothetical protein